MQKKNFSKVSYTEENQPNAGKLLESMRCVGYDDVGAINDIIDNSIDAGATKIAVDLKTVNDSLQIIIKDNGCGMNHNVLNEALRFGSLTPHDEEDDLGKFGMGLSTAGLALARITTVLTKTQNNNTILKSETNVDEVIAQNKFVKFIGEATKEESTYFLNELKNLSLLDKPIKDTYSGTIIILDNCDNVSYKATDNNKAFENAVIKSISQVFRKFMNRIQFYVNDKKVEEADPLMLNPASVKEYGLPTAEEIYTDKIEVKWNDRDGNEHIDAINVKLVHLPDCDGATAKDLGINPRNQGFSVLRNNREILFGYAPSNWAIIGTKHPSANRIRGEISFDSKLDYAMGINFKKSGLRMQDKVENILRDKLMPTIKTLIAIDKKSKLAKDSESVNHDAATTIINKKSKTLITPPAQKEDRETKTNKLDKPIEKSEPTGRIRNYTKSQLATSIAEFSDYHGSASGPIFEAGQIGKKIQINLNVDHPFYSKLIIDNKDNPEVLNPIHFMIYSLAAAQMKYSYSDEEKEEIIRTIVQDMSSNMRSLLD